MAKKVPVDDKLGYNRVNTDESYAHIEINEDFKDEAEIRKVVLACITSSCSFSVSGIYIFPSTYAISYDTYSDETFDQPTGR